LPQNLLSNTIYVLTGKNYITTTDIKP